MKLIYAILYAFSLILLLVDWTEEDKKKSKQNAEYGKIDRTELLPCEAQQGFFECKKVTKNENSNN